MAVESTREALAEAAKRLNEAAFAAGRADMDDSRTEKYTACAQMLRQARMQDLLDAIDALAAAAQAQSEPQWMPIETAPKDRNVLLFSEKYGRQSIDNWSHYNVHNQPRFTHWMPLPQPPKDNQ